MRNWLETLWPASYKGFPFWFERDAEDGGLGLVIHKFANRDQPFIEDMGEEPRFYSGHAYIFGDDVDAQAVAFAAIMVSHGPGPLVLPLIGPVTVRGQNFRRRHALDKLGYCGFDVHFVREGASGPFGGGFGGLLGGGAALTVGALANAGYGAADALASAAAAALPLAVNLAHVPDYVAAAVFSTLADGAGALEAQRLSNSADAQAAGPVRDAVSAIVVAADAEDPASVGPLATQLIATARALGAALPADVAAAALREVALSFAPVFSASPALSPWAAQASANTAAAEQCVRLAALTAYAEAVLRRDYPDRPAGVAARAEVAELFDAEQAQATGGDAMPLYLAIGALRDALIDYLTQLITDLKPVVTVTASQQLPSLVQAWRLYGDPARAAELVKRNKVRHPSFMPETFQALAA